jgi:phosphoglycolate phosphatase
MTKSPGTAGRGRIKGVLFDKDGTLFDYHGTWGPLLAEVAAALAGERISLVPAMLAAIGYREATGRFEAGSIAAAGDTFALADAWRTLLERSDREALVARLDGYFAELGPARSIPVTDLRAYFRTMTADTVRSPGRAWRSLFARPRGSHPARSRWWATTCTTSKWVAARARGFLSAC